MLVPCGEIENQPADAARGCAHASSLFASGQCANGRSRAGASTNNQRLLLPRPLVRVLRLRSPLDDARGTDQFIATDMVPDLYGMQPAFVAKIDAVRVVALLLRNEEMP